MSWWAALVLLLGVVNAAWAFEPVAASSVTISRSRIFYDRIARIYFTQNTATNTGSETLGAPLRWVVQSSTTLPVLNADGVTATGEPFFLVSSALAAGESTPILRINFQRRCVRLRYTQHLMKSRPWPMRWTRPHRTPTPWAA